ncbi:hypothetical protein [Chryseobacterium daeguense]|uniref:hypothetical protein n=1 Tax=Chryseobacterium daeguense TaxID=412438 RepID=UPI0003FF9BE6|nr:hypothetical protein [Chryseobacterium daeguense]
MEKFHKYCLSVLLVIICSNISAQITNGTAESDDCKQLYELYNRILNQTCESSQRFCFKENTKPNFAIQQKQNAIDLLGKIPKGKKQDFLSKNKSGADFSEKEKHDQLLKNFEKTGKENFFTNVLYFKTKVSKVRNKDYLSVIG